MIVNKQAQADAMIVNKQAELQGAISTATHQFAVTSIFFPSLLLKLGPPSLQCSSIWFQGHGQVY